MSSFYHLGQGSEKTMTNHSKIEKLSVGLKDAEREIAVCQTQPKANNKRPGVVWLGGFRSDMEGSKALALDQQAAEAGAQCTRHDYSGHGQSGGKFTDGTISRWLEESLAVFRKFTDGPQILVGSSMGGWIALRMMQELEKIGETHRVHGLVLLAPAPDFTKELHWPKLTDAQKSDLETKGYFEEPTPYGPDPNIFTKALFDDGENNLVMDGLLDLKTQLHIIQGMEDPDVPWQHAMKLMEHLPHDNVTLTFIRDGDHRLSRDQDIEKILNAVDMMSTQN